MPGHASTGPVPVGQGQNTPYKHEVSANTNSMLLRNSRYEDGGWVGQ